MKQELNNTISQDIRKEELQAVKKTLLSFISAFKAYTLYPADHSFSRKNVAKLNDDLDSFLNDFERLRLETRKNNFYYMGEIIYEGQPEENNPAYLLTRDGLEYIEFLQGITAPEISALLNLLNQHRNPFDESGGDIVTSLWQNNFTHILYEEVDIFALESFQFDLSTFKVSPDQSGSRADSPGKTSSPRQSERKRSRMEQRVLEAAALEENAKTDQDNTSLINKPEPISPAAQNKFLSGHGMKLLEISSAEEKVLAEYVQEEEVKNFTSDVIDVLLIILVVQKNKENFVYVLEFLEFEFFETMDRGEFHLAYKLLNNIQIIRNQFKKLKQWAVPLLDNFIAVVSDEEKLNKTWWVKNEDYLWQHTPYLSHLWKVLRILNPEIIFLLGPLTARIPIDNVHIRNELLEIIKSKAKQDPKKLNHLLKNSGEEVNLILAPIIREIPQEVASRIYLDMTHHNSAELRKIGLEGYMTVEKRPDFDELFPLLGDKNSQVRGRIRTYILTAGEKTCVQLLIRFLSQATITEPLDQKIIFENYKALASCGSVDSLSFLENNLMESKLSNMFSNRNAVHKKGAAFALKKIGTEEALAILNKGAQSLRPDIRLACQHALGR